MEVDLDETEDEIDICGPSIQPIEDGTIHKLPFSDKDMELYSSQPFSSSSMFSSKSSKKRKCINESVEQNDSGDTAAGGASAYEVKLFLDDLLPIPMSVKAGQFADKVLKEKKVFL